MCISIGSICENKERSEGRQNSAKHSATVIGRRILLVGKTFR